MTILLYTFLQRLLNKTILTCKAVPSISLISGATVGYLACDTSLPLGQGLLSVWLYSHGGRSTTMENALMRAK